MDLLEIGLISLHGIGDEFDLRNLFFVIYSKHIKLKKNVKIYGIFDGNFK